MYLVLEGICSLKITKGMPLTQRFHLREFILWQQQEIGTTWEAIPRGYLFPETQEAPRTRVCSAEAEGSPGRITMGESQDADQL